MGISKEDLVNEISDLVDEVIALRRWKAEAMTVLAEWEKVWEAAGKPGPVGSFKYENVKRVLEAGADLRKGYEYNLRNPKNPMHNPMIRYDEAIKS